MHGQEWRTWQILMKSYREAYIKKVQLIAITFIDIIKCYVVFSTKLFNTLHQSYLGFPFNVTVFVFCL